jgi:hypothetical protein
LIFKSLKLNCRNQAWLLKNSFQGISLTKLVRKLLNVRLPQALKFAEITGLVPFSTATRFFINYRLPSCTVRMLTQACS